MSWKKLSRSAGWLLLPHFQSRISYELQWHSHMLLWMFPWLKSIFYRLCVVFTSTETHQWWLKKAGLHGLNWLSNSKSRCCVMLDSVYSTHPWIDAQICRLYPLLELKNHWCSCALRHLVDYFIKITHTYSSRERWKWSRDTHFPFQLSVYSTLKPKWLLARAPLSDFPP